LDEDWRDEETRAKHELAVIGVVGVAGGELEEEGPRRPPGVG